MTKTRASRVAAILLLAAGSSGCTSAFVDAPAVTRARRTVLLGFYGNRDVELALASATFIQSRHDGEDVLVKALPTF